MKEILISNFKHKNLYYHLKYYLYENNNIRIAIPFFMISKKSLKMVNPNATTTLAKFELINSESSLPVMFRIYNDIKKEFHKYNHVVYWPHVDKSLKRGRVYEKGFERMGFQLNWKDIHNRASWYFFSRPEKLLKRKQIWHHLNAISEELEKK